MLNSRSALIFLHGSGGNGIELRGYLESLPLSTFGTAAKPMQTFRQALDSLQIDLYTPTAALRPYSPAAGSMMNVWFDRTPLFHQEGLYSTEDSEGIETSLNYLSGFIRDLEVKKPGFYNNFFIGGFSMGGGLVLQSLKKELHPKVKGLFCLSSFAVESSEIFTRPLPPSSMTIPVLMMHGDDDKLIPIDWARKTSSNLHIRNVNIQFIAYKDTAHALEPEELSDLFYWIKDLLTFSTSNSHRRELRTSHMEEKYNSIESDKPSRDIDQATLAAEHKDAMEGFIFPADDAIPFRIEKSSQSDNKYTSHPLTIIFAVPNECIPLLISHPVLACGSSFDIVDNSPNGVKVTAVTSDPEKTAFEISRRLYIRLHSASSTLNPCSPS